MPDAVTVAEAAMAEPDGAMTQRATNDTAGRPHRVARIVLLPRGRNSPPARSVLRNTETSLIVTATRTRRRTEVDRLLGEEVCHGALVVDVEADPVAEDPLGSDDDGGVVVPVVDPPLPPWWPLPPP